MLSVAIERGFHKGGLVASESGLQGELRLQYISQLRTDFVLTVLQPLRYNLKDVYQFSQLEKFNVSPIFCFD